MSHKFRVGQMVRTVYSRFPEKSGDTDYEVVRLMPESHGEMYYRIRSARSGERAVRESEIRAVTPDKRA